ncbi:MAG: hypothetical protein E3J87_03730 [Candidatus Cloacimonadota bacterium]|nr:MAG: hypothetical protein E3J87_03730 [Candidatus Cloacimonadota bacterium]
MIKEIKIYEQGFEEFPKAGIILGNFMMFLWIALGIIACWFLYPLVAWIYLSLAIVMVYIVLRKLVCTNCYYYDKWCAMGWGKLSARFFKKGNIERFNTNIGIKLAPFTYGLLSLIPLILIIISLIQKFSIYKIIVMFLLLLVSFYSGAIGRKKNCANCRMRLICPGSAVRAAPNKKHS